MNRDNLRSKDKFQNQVHEYKDLVAHCHSLGITCHAGYMLGLPFDTKESIKQDVAELQRMMFDSASFYILSPLPGSKDHQRWWHEGRWMDEDFNAYDSAHVAVKPERMSSDELMEAYRNTWEQFYSTEHMANILKIWKPDHYSYKERLSFFAWYLYSSRIERLHPMNCGFWTVRRRKDRRSGLPQEAFIPFWWNQSKRLASRLWGIAKLFFQLEDVWLRSRPKSAIEEALQELIIKTGHGIIDWRDIKVKQLATLYAKLHLEMPDIKVPSIVKLWFRKRNPFAGAFARTYAQRIWRRWYVYIWNPLKWLEVWLFECVNGFRFLGHLLGEEMKKKPTSFYDLSLK